MKKIAEFTINTVDHPLCLECPKFKECTGTCLAIEVLVQLAFKRHDHQTVIDSVKNVSELLDLENSFEM